MTPDKHLRWIQRGIHATLGILGIAALLWAWHGCTKLREQARLASCRPQLIFYMAQDYAKTHAGMFPPLSPQFGRLIFDSEGMERRAPLYDYMCEFDPGLDRRLFRKADECTPINDWSYVYLGYFLENEAQGRAFLNAYTAQTGKASAFEGDLLVGAQAGNCGTDRLFRLREVDTLPAEAAALKEKAASIPVVIEWPGHHRKGGNVVYLDGHTECRDYPGAFPMTREFMDALHAINLELRLSPVP